jgi:hypothetical protein
MQWARMSASNTTVAFGCHAHLQGAANCDYNGQVGVCGRQGLPAVENVPGSRNSAVTSVDSSWRLWLFGGEGFDAKDALNVNWLSVTITDEKGKATYDGAFVTNLPITAENAVEIPPNAAPRWITRAGQPRPIGHPHPKLGCPAPECGCQKTAGSSPRRLRTIVQHDAASKLPVGTTEKVDFTYRPQIANDAASFRTAASTAE